MRARERNRPIECSRRGTAILGRAFRTVVRTCFSIGARWSFANWSPKDGQARAQRRLPECSRGHRQAKMGSGQARRRGNSLNLASFLTWRADLRSHCATSAE